MLAKLFNAFIFGSIFVLLLDFLLFVGLKINYFDYYGIDEYFNTIFVDNQPYFLLFILSIALGYAMLYLKKRRVFDRIYIILVLVLASIFYQPIAEAVGSFLFIEKDQKLQVLDENVTTDILYRGREILYLKKPNLFRAVKYSYDEVTILE
jgi:hypothetical protein